MSKQTVTWIIVPYPCRPLRKQAEEGRTRHDTCADEEHLDSPGSLFWRGVWMVVF